jgi:hypothetical protein
MPPAYGGLGLGTTPEAAPALLDVLRSGSYRPRRRRRGHRGGRTTTISGSCRIGMSWRSRMSASARSSPLAGYGNPPIVRCEDPEAPGDEKLELLANALRRYLWRQRCTDAFAIACSPRPVALAPMPAVQDRSPHVTLAAMRAGSCARVSTGSLETGSGLATTRECGSCAAIHTGRRGGCPEGAAPAGPRAVTALLAAVWLLLDFPWACTSREHRDYSSLLGGRSRIVPRVTL